MPDPELDLLTEPLLCVCDARGAERHLTLPGVLATLGAEDVESFQALQAHQTHAWHAFLVQLAAIALHRAGENDPNQSEERWRQFLLALTDGRHEPWCLVVPDLGQPAFLQPPVPEGSLARFQRIVEQPDELDVLVTTKNHDVKRARIAAPRPDNWVAALISLQTMASYAGRDTYGVARMNGGFGSRPGVGFASGFSLGARFLRDVGVLLGARPSMESSVGFAADGGHALLWLLPWDGTRSLSLEECDPFFIEICRRTRLVRDGGAIVARGTSTKAPRVEAKIAKGNTGDPWTPVKRDDGAALTVTGAGFTYDIMQRLLFEQDFVLGAAARPRPAERGHTLFSAMVLAGGQGETNGFHERWLPIPGRVHLSLSRAADRNRIVTRSRQRVERVATARLKVLKPSLCALLQAGADQLDYRDDRPQRWLDRFDHAVDRVFFEQLWADADADDEEADRRWADQLHHLARAQLADAIESAPLPAARRYRAITAAERVFGGAWIRQFGPSSQERSA